MLFTSFFLIAGIFIKKTLERQVVENSQKALEVLVVGEGQEMEKYFRKTERLGINSAHFIEELLTDYREKPDDTRLFNTKYKMIDGALRSNIGAFDGGDVSGVFLSNRTALNDEIRWIIMATEAHFDYYAKGVLADVFNMYLITRHGLIRIYEKDWALEIEAGHDFNGDVFYNIADPKHNPEKKQRWTEPYYDSIWKRWMTSLITPIYIDGQFLGIVGHDVVLDDLYRNILSGKYYQSGYGLIFDEQHNLVVHPRYLNRLLDIAEMGTPLKPGTVEDPELDVALGRAIEKYRRAKTKLSVDFFGEDEQFLLLTYKVDFLNWFYAIVVPRAEVTSLLPVFIRDFISGMTAVSIFLFAFVVAITWFSVVRPISRLTGVARAIQNGYLDRRAEIGSGDEIGHLAVAFNAMTDRLEKSLQELEGDLRRKELADEEKKRIIDQLERSNAELERFTYTVSHDLKSPLVTISGYLQLLKKHIEEHNEEGIVLDLDYLTKAAMRMKQLLDELLELSRVGRVINEPVEFSLYDLTAEVLVLLAGTIEDKKAVVNISPDLPRITADRERMLEVMQNLLSNAIKYSQEDLPPLIDVGVKQVNGKQLIYVSDNGIGIDPYYHEIVFGLFNQLDRNIPGTGIGLALVKRIIEVHGGKIWVESKGRGHGSTFYFTLE